MARPKKVLYYRAKESFVATVGHDHVNVQRGELASADYKNRPGGAELWEPVTDDHVFVRFFNEDEQATAAPGEKRGSAPEAPVDEEAGVEDFDSLTLDELRDVARERGVTPGSMKKAELIDAIKLRGQ